MKKVMSLLLMCLVLTVLGGINTKEVAAETKVKSIEITSLPDKLAYNTGEGYSTKGMVVEATMSDGSKEIVENSKITSFSGVELTEGRLFQQEGSKSVELKYQSAKTSFWIAVFNPSKKYSITFDSNGGSAVEAIQIDASTKEFKLSTPTKKGAKFLGWYHSNGMKYTKYEQGMGPDLQFKAKWGYEIVFKANGGTGKMKNGVLDSEYELPKSGFKKSGYKFVGWSTKKTTDQSSFYNVGDSASSIPNNKKEVTLYAQWVKAKTYKISYSSVKGVVNPSKAIKKYTSGKTTELPYPDITRDYPSKSEAGVMFGGWKITVNGKVLGTFNEIPPYISGDIKLTPVVYELDG